MKTKQLRWVMPDSTSPKAPILQERTVLQDEGEGSEPHPLTMWTNVDTVFDDRQYRMAENQS